MSFTKGSQNRIQNYIKPIEEKPKKKQKKKSNINENVFDIKPTWI
jgi:hypothetical protein